MTDAMTVRATLETGMRFDVETGSGHHVILDAAEQNGGQDTGPRPMEMLLVALGKLHWYGYHHYPAEEAPGDYWI